MKLSRETLAIIVANAALLSPTEINNILINKGLKPVKEHILQKRIDLTNGCYNIKEARRKIYEQKAIANPIRHRASTLYAGAKHRAKLKGIPFDLTISWIENKLKHGFCEATNLPFFIKHYAKKESYIKVHQRSPSLDQINPSAGYTKDNVQVVCDQFNKMKSDKSMKETLFLAKHFVRHQLFTSKTNIRIAMRKTKV